MNMHTLLNRKYSFFRKMKSVVKPDSCQQLIKPSSASTQDKIFENTEELMLKLKIYLIRSYHVIGTTDGNVICRMISQSLNPIFPFVSSHRSVLHKQSKLLSLSLVLIFIQLLMCQFSAKGINWYYLNAEFWHMTWIAQVEMKFYWLTNSM